MNLYYCPKCHKHYMQWDGRAKVLMCYRASCVYIIRIPDHFDTPTNEEILKAIEDNCT